MKATQTSPIELRGLIFDIQRYSIHDGPGIRTLVFMKGCPLRCLWCSNPESQSDSSEMIVYPSKCIGCDRCVEVCPTGAAQEQDIGAAKQLCQNCGACVDVCPSTARQMAGRIVSVEEVLAEVKKDTPFYRRSSGGVTISGGEPLMQDEFVAQLLKRCRAAGIHTAIETCGFSGPERLRKVLQHVDLVLFDLKHMHPTRHRELTGVGNEVILENATIAARGGTRTIFRVPIIPGYNDDEENIERIAVFVSGLNPTGEVHLIPYHRLGASKHAALGRAYPLADVQAVERDSLRVPGRIIEGFGLKVQLGG